MFRPKSRQKLVEYPGLMNEASKEVLDQKVADAVVAKNQESTSTRSPHATRLSSKKTIYAFGITQEQVKRVEEGKAVSNRAEEKKTEQETSAGLRK